MSRATLDLVREVLDRELVDVDGVSCGRVDDIELALDARGGPQVTALLTGPGAWAPRLPALLHAAALALCGGDIVRLPWDEVASVTDVVRLKRRAAELRLGRLDRKAGTWLAALPRS